MLAIQFCPVHVAFFHVASIHSATNWPPSLWLPVSAYILVSRGDAGLKDVFGIYGLWTPYPNHSNFILKSNLLLENWQTDLT